MLSDEVWKAIEGIKKDDEYYDILENIKQNKYNMLNVEKLMRDTTTGDYTEYEIAQSIVYFVNLIEKQSKEIEELKEESKEYQIGFAQGCYEKDLDWEDKIKAKIEELDLAVFKNQTIYTVNKMQEIKFARLCLAELLEKE